MTVHSMRSLCTWASGTSGLPFARGRTCGDRAVSAICSAFGRTSPVKCSCLVGRQTGAVVNVCAVTNRRQVAFGQRGSAVQHVTPQPNINSWLELPTDSCRDSVSCAMFKCNRSRKAGCLVADLTYWHCCFSCIMHEGGETVQLPPVGTAAAVQVPVGP